MVNDAFVTPTMIFAGLVGGDPVEPARPGCSGCRRQSSHALFGGLIGAVLVGAGVSGVNFSVVVSKILLPAVVAPVVAGRGGRRWPPSWSTGWLRRADQEPGGAAGSGGRRPCPGR